MSLCCKNQVPNKESSNYGTLPGLTVVRFGADYLSYVQGGTMPTTQTARVRRSRVYNLRQGEMVP
jgi:hypothetical protein